MITFGLIDFALLAPERLEYGEYFGRVSLARNEFFLCIEKFHKLVFDYFDFDDYLCLVLDRKK